MCNLVKYLCMKKIVILAISAILAVNISAQEQKKEQFAGKQLSKEEKVELKIQHLTQELMLSDQQAEKFAATFREYAAEKAKLFSKKDKKKGEQGKELSDAELDQLAKQRFEEMKKFADLQAKYYDKFRKDLSARQVERVLHLNEPFGKPCCGKGFKPGDKPCGKQCGKHEGPCGEKHGKHEHKKATMPVAE